MIITREFLTHQDVDACPEAIAWMDANDAWGWSYTDLKDEFQRQADTGEFDPEIVNAEMLLGWISYWEKRRRNPSVLRLGGQVTETEETRVRLDGKTYKGLDPVAAKKLKDDRDIRIEKNKLTTVSVNVKVDMGKGVVKSMPVKKLSTITDGSLYTVFDPRDGVHHEFSSAAETLEKIEEVFIYKKAKQRKRDCVQRKIIDTAEGFEAWEDIE